MAQRVSQRVVVASEGNLDESKRYSNIQLFNEDGTPFTAGEGGAAGTTGYTGEVVAGENTLAFEDGVLKTVTPV